MPNGRYLKGKKAILDGDIDFLVDTIQVILVDTALYTVDLVNHDFLNDIPVGARVGSAVTLSGKDTTDGVFDANNISFTGLVSAPTIEALVIYKSTGTESTSALIAYFDTATGLPVAAGATQVDVTWDNGPNKIFRS